MTTACAHYDVFRITVFGLNCHGFLIFVVVYIASEYYSSNRELLRYIAQQ